MSRWGGLPLIRIRRPRQNSKGTWSQPAEKSQPVYVDFPPAVARFAAEMARVAAEQEHPRLWVGFDCPGRWGWSVTAPDACLLDSGHGETWAEAIAVGLAALELASMRAV